jgi:glycosyltransferase involved in cell wall biosynthesis
MMDPNPPPEPTKRSRTTAASFLWWVLTRYGQFKHRYLLPVYGLFGLLPKQSRTDGTLQPSWTLRSAQALVRRWNRGFYLDQLKQVMERASTAKGTVIFLPSVSWSVVNTQRTHHLARELARQGYVSIFDGSNSIDEVSGFKELAPNFFLFRGADNVLTKIADPTLWALTYNFDRRDSYSRSARVIYDWIDDFEVFPFDQDFLERNHNRALREATLVLCVAQRLHEQAKAVRADSLYLPNGVEFEHFASNPAPLNDRDIDEAWLEGKPLAGYYGAIAEWFDYELMEAVARLRPDWNFLLIGPMHDNSLKERGQLMLGCANVRWIGQRSYEDIPAYLGMFDVAMIPFVINRITLATSPLKLYEYFAGGKPVVATPMPECQAFAEVQIADNAQAFSKALDRARTQGMNPEFRERLRMLGRENSWATRVKLVLEHLALARK